MVTTAHTHGHVFGANAGTFEFRGGFLDATVFYRVVTHDHQATAHFQAINSSADAFLDFLEFRGDEAFSVDDGLLSDILLGSKSSTVLNGIAFGQSAAARYIKSKRSFDIAFTIEENIFKKNQVQLQIEDIRPNEG